MSLRFLMAALLAVLLACAGDAAPTEGADPAAEQAPGETAGQPEQAETDAGAASEPDGGGEGGDGAGSDGGAALEEVYAQLEGLEGEEREARLVELAQAEEGDLSLYTSMNLDNAGPLADEFESMYDVSVSIYRAVADTVATRYSQEVDAGFPGADLVSLNAAPLTELDGEGLLLPLDTPTTSNLDEASVYDNWASTWLNVYTAAWNTDLVSPERAPTTWEEVLAFEGAAGWEPRDFDWMGTLVLDHFMAEKGMTEEAAIDLFRQGAQNAQAINGHTVMVEYLAAGQLEMAASVYHHTVTQFMADGAPLDWQPPVEPLIALPDGIGIAVNTQRPAGSLLFIDFMMTRGQEILAELGRTPASPNVEGGISPDVEVININFDVFEDREKWEGIMQEIIQQ